METVAFSIHPATRLGHVALTVADVDRQVGFYRNVLGFHLHWQKGDDAGLGAGEEDLLRLTTLPGGRRARGTTGLYHFAVLFPTRREFARALARLIALRYPNAPTDHLMTETTYLNDPEGNGIELYVDTPQRGRWFMSEGTFAARDPQGRLHSGREPLDVEDVLKELGPADALDIPVPGQTSIGHVHLHVADLDEAVRFYNGVLGFDVQGNARTLGAAFVSAGGYHHHIGLNTWLGDGAPPPPPDALGLRYFTIVLPAHEAYERVVARLDDARLTYERTPEGVLVRDPSRSGVVLTVAQPPAEETRAPAGRVHREVMPS
ncbi:MAG TPA: VOC family protein [bacterium]|jgi:catechol 2,3-dioxygenase|nr:VOC family protein [bacterium]